MQEKSQVMRMKLNWGYKSEREREGDWESKRVDRHINLIY